MKKNQSLSFAITAIMLLAVAPIAWGSPFENPPETNPNIDWETTFSYQRNIFLDFNQNPVGPVGPIPGADYEGYDDPVLWDSDFVEFTGDVEWNATLGAVGIFDAPAEGASGTLIVHIDNWERPWPVKHIYEEMVWRREAVATWWFYQEFLGLPDGYVEQDNWWWEESDPSHPNNQDLSLDYWVEILPNPPWEEKIISFEIEPGTPGSNLYVKSLHLATECVPEPATLGLLVLGGLAVLRRKRSI